MARDTRRQRALQTLVRRDVAWQTVIDMRLKPVAQRPQRTPRVVVAELIRNQGELAVAGQVVRVETIPTQPLVPAME